MTAAALFDGHDAAINMIRRLLQQQGAEVIHLGHNRSVSEVVEAALQEDVDGVAVSSYQGGHLPPQDSRELPSGSDRRSTAPNCNACNREYKPPAASNSP